VDATVAKDTEQKPEKQVEHKKVVEDETEVEDRKTLVEGSVAAIRADQQERDSQQKERIDRLIKKRYRVTGKNPYSVITLKDGSTVTAKDVTKQNDSYAMQTVMNEDRTVFASKEFSKPEVASIEPESGDEIMWLRVKQSRVPANAMDGYQHGRMIALIFDYFLDEYPDSEHASKVIEMRETWVQEKTKLDNTWMKVDRKWYGPDDIPAKRFPKSSRRAIAALRKSMANGQYLKAASLYGKIQIPPEFDKERQAVIAMRSKIEEGLEHYLNESAKTAVGEREHALKTYEKELAKFKTWKPKKQNSTRSLLSETKSEYQVRLKELQKESKGELKVTQGSARRLAYTRFNEAKKESHLKHAEAKRDVQRAHRALDKSSL
jgi:hypothetical protein